MIRLNAWLRVALIDLRGSIRKFLVLIACMALAVATIGTIATLRVSIDAAIASDTRSILGGDLEILSRRADIADAARAELATLGRVTRLVELNTQARAGDRVTFLSLRAVDDNFPLIGAVELDPHAADVRVTDLLEERDGVYGLLLSRRAAFQLGVEPGALVRIGLIETELRGIIASLPDDAALGFQLGAPALLSSAALVPAGLRQEGVLNQFRYKLLLGETDFPAARERLETGFPDADWSIRSPREATAGLARFIDIFSNFMLLVGLTSLVVGGIGVANSASAYLAARQDGIATMRALGASGGRITAHFLIQILVFSTIGVVIGLIAIVVLTALAAPVLATVTNLNLTPILEPGIMASTTGLALATALTFSWLPLRRAAEVRPARLFRSAAAGVPEPVGLRGLLRPGTVLPLLVGLAAIAGLMLAIIEDVRLVAIYLVGVLAALLLLRLVAAALMRLLARLPTLGHRVLRFALSAVTRPGAPTATIVVSLGMGLALMLLIATSQANIDEQLTSQLDGEVPDFVLLDMPRSEFATVSDFVASVPEVVRFASVPMLRGVISALNGEPPPSANTLGRDVADMFRGDTALTWSAAMPDGTFLDGGKWWAEDYAGPPLVSLSTEMRDALGLALGDTIEVTISGRPLTLTIESFRLVNWRSPAFNFRIIVSPGAIEAAPQSYFTTIQVTPGTERDVEARLLAAFPGLAFVPVREAIERAQSLLGDISAALAIVGATSLVAGILVLASALGVGRRQREADAVVMKILGARRAVVILAFLLEYAILGAITAFVATGIALVGAWSVSTWLLELPFALRLDLLAMIAISVVAITASTGAAATWSAMTRNSSAYIREADLA